MSPPPSIARLSGAAVVVAAAWVACLAAPAAGALGLYGAAALGAATADLEVADPIERILDDEDDSWSLAIGARLGRYLAFELGYHDFGRAVVAGPGGAEVGIDSTAFALSVLPHLPLGKRFFLYGRLGAVSFESDLGSLVGDFPFSGDLDGEELLFGAGARVLFPGPLGLFAEYAHAADAFELVALGATLGF